MSNCHYIPRCVTKDWELENRQLHWFDFKSDRFGVSSSKRLFAREGLNSDSVEKMLDRLIETPVGAYLHQAMEQGELPDITLRDQRLARALGLLFILTFQRLAEVKGEHEQLGPTLAEMERRGDEYLNQLAEAAFHRLQFRTVTLPEHLEMFFTEMGAFSLPMAGQPTMVMPLGVRFALVARRNNVSREELRQHVETGLIQGFSLGVGVNVNRVVLPPFWVRQLEHDENNTRARLRTIRDEARKMCNLIAQASGAIRIDGWQTR